MASITRKAKRYPSDMTEEKWERIAPSMPEPGRTGRPREIEFGEVINAVRYLVRSRCDWRNCRSISGIGVRSMAGSENRPIGSCFRPFMTRN